MSGYKTYRLGRSRDADITISDASVSRRHAELIATGDGRYYINDCGSRYGTFVLHNGRWKAVRQVFVRDSDRIKLGEYETSVLELVGRIGGRPIPDANPDDEAFVRSTRLAGQRTGGTADGESSAKADLPRGEVERDPETGEIIRKA